MNTKIAAIGADHAGFKYKEYLKKVLVKEGYTILDKGTNSEDSVDYPDFAHPVAITVENKEAALGVVICGSGNGVCISANKHQQVRAALAWNVEVAEIVRKHNDANVLCIPARFVSKEMAKKMLLAFLHTDFEGGRHGRRVDKIACM